MVYDHSVGMCGRILLKSEMIISLGIQLKFEVRKILIIPLCLIWLSNEDRREMNTKQSD